MSNIAPILEKVMEDTPELDNDEFLSFCDQLLDCLMDEAEERKVVDELVDILGEA
jgi:hypothetical protein